MDAAKIRRATSVAQALLLEVDPTLVIDGKPGTHTLSRYQVAPDQLKKSVDDVLQKLGVRGGMRALYDAYKSGVKAGASTAKGAESVFALQVVPAIIREARKRGVQSAGPIAQFALETGWGSKVPMLPDGRNSWNYGGIKWNTDKTAEKVFKKTREVFNGKSQVISDAFAVYNSPDEFAKAYFDYVLVRSQRYPGLRESRTAEEWGAIMQRGGYATDPKYAQAIAQVGKSAMRKFPDLA